MILNSIRLNNLQTGNNILFQKRHKNRAKGHISSQKPDLFIRMNDKLEDNSGLYSNKSRNHVHSVIIDALSEFDYPTFVSELSKRGEFVASCENISIDKDENNNPVIKVFLYEHNSDQNEILIATLPFDEFIDILLELKKISMNYPKNKTSSYDSFTNEIIEKFHMLAREASM